MVCRLVECAVLLTSAMAASRKASSDLSGFGPTLRSGLKPSSNRAGRAKSDLRVDAINGHVEPRSSLLPQVYCHIASDSNCEAKLSPEFT